MRPEQAKGILIGERRCTPGDALAGLTTMAHDTNRTVREAAQPWWTAPLKPPDSSRLRPAGS